MDTIADRIFDLVESIADGALAAPGLDRQGIAEIRCELALLGRRARGLVARRMAPAPVVTLPARLQEHLAGLAANAP